MTSEYAIFLALKNGLVLILLWAMITHLYPKCVLDWLRQRLFDLRDQLFLIATDNRQLFENRVYQTLRSQINAHIRYAHKLNLAKLLYVRLSKSDDIEEYCHQIEKAWNKDLASLDVETQKQFIKIKNSVTNLVLLYIVFRSIYSIFSVSAYLVFAFLPTYLYRLLMNNVSLGKDFEASKSKVVATALELSELDRFCKA